MRKPVVVWNCRNSLREHLNGLPYLKCLCRKSEDLYKYYNDKQRIAQHPNPPKIKTARTYADHMMHPCSHPFSDVQIPNAFCSDESMD